MKRPSIRVASKPVREPTGLPKPRPAEKEENPKLALAKKAVEEFENQRRMLSEMKEDWASNFPEANEAYQDILQQEDLVVETIAAAKVLVAEVKTSVGEFKATRKFEKPHYDSKELKNILASLEDRATVLEDLFDSGIISSIELNREASIAWFAQRPTYSDTFESAFKEKNEKTCAVSVPKI
jgi:hypothetical protein